MSHVHGMVNPLCEKSSTSAKKRTSLDAAKNNNITWYGFQYEIRKKISAHAWWQSCTIWPSSIWTSDTSLSRMNYPTWYIVQIGYPCDVLFCTTAGILIYAGIYMIHVLFPQWSVHSTSTVFTQLLTVQICKSDDFRIQQSGQLNTRSVISGFSQNIGSTIQIRID